MWGVAYKIRTEDIEQVTKHLDFREKNGYVKKTVTFHPKEKDHEPFKLTLYVATEENESYAGKIDFYILYYFKDFCGQSVFIICTDYELNYIICLIAYRKINCFKNSNIFILTI